MNSVCLVVAICEWTQGKTESISMLQCNIDKYAVTTTALVTVNTLTVYTEVLGPCVGVKMDSRLGPTLTNQSLVQ